VYSPSIAWISGGSDRISEEYRRALIGAYAGFASIVAVKGSRRNNFIFWSKSQAGSFEP
jgi:hypothetical protein